MSCYKFGNIRVDLELIIDSFDVVKNFIGLEIISLLGTILKKISKKNNIGKNDRQLKEKAHHSLTR